MPREFLLPLLVSFILASALAFVNMRVIARYLTIVHKLALPGHVILILIVIRSCKFFGLDRLILVSGFVKNRRQSKQVASQYVD